MSIYHTDDLVREALVNAAHRERPPYARKATTRLPGTGSIYVDRRGAFIASLRGEYIGRYKTDELANAAIVERAAKRVKP